MGTLDFNLLSEDKAKKVNKLIEELGCSIETAMFWLRSYSWDYERTKKYLSTCRELTEEAKKACEEVASELNKFAEKKIIRPTDEAVKKVNDMAKKFQTTYNSIVDSLKENDWSFEKVEKLFSEKQKENNKNEQALTVSFEATVTFDDLIKKLSSLPSDAKIKIVKEIFASENEAFVKKLIKEMLLEQL